MLCPFSGRRPENWRTGGVVAYSWELQNVSATSPDELDQTTAGVNKLLDNQNPDSQKSPVFHQQASQNTLRRKKPKTGSPSVVPSKGIDEQICNIKLEAHDKEAVYEIFSSSYSRQNFAWRLVRYMFSDSELKDHNCYGRKGKPSLDVGKLSMVRELVFAYYPLDHFILQQKAWKACTVAIDKGIRNTFCDYHPRQ